jgi:hypothetical protein
LTGTRDSGREAAAFRGLRASRIRGSGFATGAIICTALALVSAALTLPDTWRWLSDQRSDLRQLDAVDRFQAPGFNNRLPVGAFDFFRANVRRGDRVFVHAREGTTVRGVDFPTGARTFARYYLLPATVVESPQDATVVVAIGRDPRELGLSYRSTLREGDFQVARVRDPA